MVGSLGYAFHVASELEGELAAFLDRVEDAAVQADEVDDQYLQYEGGVGITCERSPTAATGGSNQPQ